MSPLDRGTGARSSPLLGLCALALPLVANGCAAGVFGDPSGYDSQACVEHALRQHPDPETSAQAVMVFGDACRHGDPGACSALGVAYEVGLTGVADRRAAAVHYHRACALGNVTGCRNLEALGARPRAEPSKLLVADCSSNPSACKSKDATTPEAAGSPSSTLAIATSPR